MVQVSSTGLPLVISGDVMMRLLPSIRYLPLILEHVHVPSLLNWNCKFIPIAVFHVPTIKSSLLLVQPGTRKNRLRRKTAIDKHVPLTRDMKTPSVNSPLYSRKDRTVTKRLVHNIR